MVSAHSLPQLAAGALELGLSLSADQMALFERYYAALEAGRRRASLTSVTGRDAVQRRHFLESLALLRALERATVLAEEQPARVLDLGSGAGLPGLPMKIARPHLELTLLDATAKKTSFLRELLTELELADVRLLTGRAEDLGRDPEHRAAYDTVVARAVAPLAALVELALPFLRLGGTLASPKGSAAQREASEAARALNELGGAVVSAEPLDTPGGAHRQTLILVEKTRPTPDKYPRRTGVPQKRPL
jgi:16S rRNA (guanine527-N7)-methyltransferase